MSVRAALEWCGRYGTWLLPTGIVLGCLLQPLAEVLRPVLPLTVFFMLATVLARLDIERAILHLRKPHVFVASLVWTLVVTPLIFVAMLWIFPMSPGIQAALIIYATSPPNFAAAALAFVMGLDGALTVATILVMTALHPLVTPAATAIFTEGAIAIPASELALRLAGMVGGAALAAWGLRRWMGKHRQAELKLTLDGVNVLLMMIFVIALMDGIPARVIAEPALSLGLVVLCFALHIGLNLLTSLAFLPTGKARALTLGYTHAGRNIAVVMGVLGSAVPDDAWLFFAMLQFPIYCLPALLKPYYRKVLPVTSP